MGDWFSRLQGKAARVLSLPLPLLAGLSLAWLAASLLLPADAPWRVAQAPGQIGLAMVLWRLLRDGCWQERLPLAWLLLMLGQRLLLSQHLVNPEDLLWQVLTLPGTLTVTALVLVQAGEEIWLHRPWRTRRRELLGLWAAALLGAIGLVAGSPLMLMPLLVRPVLRWLRNPALRPRLAWYALFWLILLAWAWTREITQGLQLQAQSETFNLHIGEGLGQGRLLETLGPLQTIAQAWLGLQLPAALLVLVGRLLRQSRIRTKLAMNALFSSVLPLILLTLLFGTMAVIVMGSYRARLVRAQFDQRLESGRLVTAWFAQAFADPLDRSAQRRFEQQLRSMGDETHIGRGFFCLYWSADTPGGSVAPGEGDSLRREHWRRLVATWRMPSDFPLEEIQLPPDWRAGCTAGLVRVGQRAWQVSLIEQNNLLSAGFFPLDEEALEEIGTTLGTSIRLVSVEGEENLVRFGLRQIGLRPEADERELDCTREFPGADAPLRDRIFQVGLARLVHEGFPLNPPGEELLVQVESLPGRILPAVLMDDMTIVFPYVLLLLLQLLVLAPLLVTGIWIAWMLNWRITRSIGELKLGTDELARGNLDIRLPEETDDELGLLARSFNTMSRRIRDNMRQLAAQERLERELSIARTIQQGLLPGEAPEHPALDIASTCRMAHEVGGDYYDFRRNRQGDLALALGDVSGKGMAAALVMSNVQASWRSLLDQGLDPGRLNARLNDQLAETTADDIYVTFVQGLIRSSADGLRFHYSNAGHNPPLLVRDGRIRHLDSGGLALGMFGGSAYQTEDLDLKPGDQLVFYTDGLTEAMSTAEEEFGQRRLEQTLLSSRQPCARDTLQHLLEVVDRFETGARQYDDQTLVVLHVRDAVRLAPAAASASDPATPRDSLA
jgi:serine phosphatase RsbU (regulator of sigma subunit)